MLSQGKVVGFYLNYLILFLVTSIISVVYSSCF